MKRPVVITFTGRANSGKTTLITRLIDYYNSLGYSSAVIKSTNHPLEISGMGKDTGIFLKQGAKATIVTDGDLAILEAPVENVKADPGKLVESYLKGFDIVFIEGFKLSSEKKIEVVGDSTESPLYLDGIKNIIFLVSDHVHDTDLKVYKRDDINGVAAHLNREFSISPDKK